MGIYTDPLGHKPIDWVTKINIAKLERQSEELNAELVEAKKVIEASKQEQAEFKARLEGFYSKMIEIFGLFIAIFSFIIAGIQTAAKADGGFWEKLGTSAAVFIPVTVCICALLWMIRWTSHR